MSLILGNTSIGQLYVGSTKIGHAYLGSSLVYQVSSGGTQRVVYTAGTCTKMTLSLGGRNYRAQFLVLPTLADNSQFATCNNGINTGNGAGIFWVTQYTIDSTGALHVTGYKAAYTSNSCSNSSSWPTANSNRLYYYGSQTFGGVTSEAHKFGLNVPSNAVAVLVAYKGQAESQLTCNTIATNKTYSSVQDATCGFCIDEGYVNDIYGLAAGTTKTYDVAATEMYYPLATNRTILCGSKNFLTAL